MTLRQRLTDIDSGFARLLTVWLSGVLAGELLVVFTIGFFREFRSISTTMDWVIAVALALLSIVIFVVAVRDEFGSE